MNKEKYTKPYLHVETFKLSQSVAAGCSVTSKLGTLTASSISVCGFATQFKTLWIDAAEGGACGKSGMDENSQVNGYCYNAPSGGYNIFAS